MSVFEQVCWAHDMIAVQGVVATCAESASADSVRHISSISLACDMHIT